MARRRYSDEERAAALAALRANGGNLSKTSRQAGVPRATLQEWMNNPDAAAPPELRQEKKEALSAVFERVARAYLGRAEEPDAIAETRGKDAVIAAATAADKQLLLTGKPTVINENRPPDLSKLTDQELAEYVRLLERATGDVG